MGLIDQILSGAAGSAQKTAAANPIATVQMVMKAVQGFPGGMQGLLQRLSEAGLSAQVKSWVSGGPNLPVTADQIMQALGAAHLQPVARQFGVDQEQVANSTADLLPDLVDRLTPEGREDDLDAGLSGLAARIPGPRT
jgi:uncharacterized protein YidB (DUF937 family)